jgi:hypothetical protein
VVSNKGAQKNLALGTTASLKDNDGYSLGPARGTLYAENGIDGDMTTMAQAGGKYPWTFVVDLNKVNTGLKTVTVNFSESNFATDFKVYASADAKSWTTVAEKSDNSDIKCVFPLKNINARYFMIRAFKPDARGQKGAQMGIMEFEVTQ